LRASRRWTDLKMSARAPLLPAGYPVMMLLALVPPVFFAVMHPRLDALGGSERTPR